MLITKKHKERILVFFDNFAISAKQGRRIKVKNMQKMLGLQIWISTVFRITRQFLTSLCDVLRFAYRPDGGDQGSYFFPRKHKPLVERVLFDLKFWRRFVQQTPKTSFDYLLDRLPRNDSRMYSDASSRYGMGGVIIFGNPGIGVHSVEGVF